MGTEKKTGVLANQEAQLKSKYGNLDRRKGNHLLMKKLADKKQYFDSGDYNMQKERTKLAKPNPLALRMPVPIHEANQLTRAKPRVTNGASFDTSLEEATSPKGKLESPSSLAKVSN